MLTLRCYSEFISDQCGNITNNLWNAGQISYNKPVSGCIHMACDSLLIKSLSTICCKLNVKTCHLYIGLLYTMLFQQAVTSL